LAERIVGLDLKLLAGRRILPGDPRSGTGQPFRLDPPPGRHLIEKSVSGSLDLGCDTFFRSVPHLKPKPHMGSTETITDEEKAVDLLPVQ
jgi:hypothetical protein